MNRGLQVIDGQNRVEGGWMRPKFPFYKDWKAAVRDRVTASMFHPAACGPLTRLRMAPTVLGRPVREVSAYAFADLLIDTGPSATASRLVEWGRGTPVRREVLAPTSGDHTGCGHPP